MQISRVPALRRVPVAAARKRRHLVVYWSSGAYADSPRAIFEELRRRDAPLEHVWILRDRSRSIDGARVVERGSAAALRALGQAGHLVTSDSMPGYYRKRRHTTYVQAWHGTPLKRIAFDIDNPRFANSERYFRNLARDVATWDYLVSPNAFSTEVLRRAFRYDGPVLETGYPRNDMLFAEDRDQIRTRVREDLGIEPAATAVLYAPTFRDGQPFTLALDLPALADALGSDHVLLVRAHKLVATGAAVDAHPAVRNVSAWEEVAELYLAADVIVTDYSSVMFDFAVTRKPMLFFTYDLDEYRDRTRGFYFDFENEAPGPLLTTTDEVLGQLADIDGVERRYRAAYDAFHARFCGLEDGRAAARVIDQAGLL